MAPLSSLHLGCLCDEISERARRAPLLRRCANGGVEKGGKKKGFFFFFGNFELKHCEIPGRNDSVNESFCETRDEATTPGEGWRWLRSVSVIDTSQPVSSLSEAHFLKKGQNPADSSSSC